MPKIESVGNNLFISSPNAFEKVTIETNCAQGRDCFEINSGCAHREKLALFLTKHGYANSSPEQVLEEMLKTLGEQNTKRVRLEKLGIKRDVSLSLPHIGQAHELEFANLRSRALNQALTAHAQDFVSSNNNLNGVSEIKIVSETLGELSEDATTEIILGPASNKLDYDNLIAKIQRFQLYVLSQPEGQKISLIEAFNKAYGHENSGVVNKAAEIWNDKDEDGEGPCVHTTRGLPIRAISTVLREPQSRLSKEAKIVLNYACLETDKLVGELGLRAPHQHKLWELLNLSLWMSACEGIVSPLIYVDEQKTHTHNKTLKSWTLFAGKNFSKIVPRFGAGDLLRSGGLQARDTEQIRQLFGSEDGSHNEENFEKFVIASKNIINKFIKFLKENKNKDYNEIATILEAMLLQPEKKSVDYYVRSDLRMDFMPNAYRQRYPEDSAHNYGRAVITNTRSPSFAHSQFLPRRELLKDKAPVSGAFEFRANEHVGNARMEAFFTRDRKRSRNDFEASWNHFESYVERLAKRSRRA